MSWTAFSEASNTLISYNAAELARIGDLGKQLSFSESANRIEKIQTLLHKISPEIEDYVPPRLSQSSYETLVGIIQNIGEIVQFRPTSKEAVSERRAIVEAVENLYTKAFTELSLLISISSSITGNSEKDEEINSYAIELSQLLKEAKSQIQELQDKSKSDYETIRDILNSARSTAAELSTISQSQYFITTSENYGIAASRWLLATAVSAGLLVALSALFMWAAILALYSNVPATDAAQFTLSKLLLVGVIGYITSMCAKNYFANNHNKTVNEHRSNALASYKIIVDSTSTPEHRDIILAHAASAVFAPQDTAFVKNASTPVELPTTIINSLSKGVV